MDKNLYSRLQTRIILLTLFVSFAPLLLLGVILYRQFAAMYTEKIREQIQFRAESRADAVDLFLAERTAILGTIADTHSLAEMANEENLAASLAIINARAGAFVDLGVIDQHGTQLAYVGPYDLKGKNYFEQPWFGQVMSRGVHISDVYLGFRRLPHFIIAVRRQERQRNWVLRATIDPEIFGRIVQVGQIGKTGDAFLLNREGILQTPPRLAGKILEPSPVKPALFGKQTMVVDGALVGQPGVLFAGTWLKSTEWLLVVSGDVEEDMAQLFAARTIQVAIIVSGMLAIVLTTVLTTRTLVRQMMQAETRLREMDAQLIQADKLAALGKMAAGVAHEINNPLAVILQKTGWMRDLLAEEDLRGSPNFTEFRDAVLKIEEHVERARKVVHDMLGYARRMEPRTEAIDVNRIIHQTVDILKNYARNNNIEIQTDLQPDLPRTTGDGSQLQQVILNLVNNAIDAIGQNGRIVVRSETAESAIRITVTDNGPGIPEHMQRKVFDPFFTTKGTGKGTGLGLWISYNIIEKMGGKMTLQSKPGEGATFTIVLPVITPASE
ncbi:MAG: ATP-binding protein [Desulfobacterales bacterium]